MLLQVKPSPGLLRRQFTQPLVQERQSAPASCKLTSAFAGGSCVTGGVCARACSGEQQHIAMASIARSDVHIRTSGIARLKRCEAPLNAAAAARTPACLPARGGTAA